MLSPLDFLHAFRAELREAGIRFAITSGMACVHYGRRRRQRIPIGSQHLDFFGRPRRWPEGKVRRSCISKPSVRSAGQAIYAGGLARAAVLANLDLERLTPLAPPLDEMLP